MAAPARRKALRIAVQRGSPIGNLTKKMRRPELADIAM
jgi:hypothetical protein